MFSFHMSGGEGGELIMIGSMKKKLLTITDKQFIELRKH